MNKQTYIWCPDCARLTTARVSRGAFGITKMHCTACGTAVKQTRAHAAKHCPDCGSTIHAPLDLLPSIPCPCKAPSPQTYAWCSACGHVAPVDVTETLLGQKGVCRHCGAKMALDGQNISVCPDCGSTLYGQSRRAATLLCPCGEPDFLDEDADFTEVPSAPPAAEPALHCACGAVLEPAGDMLVCPVCPRTYSADEIRTKRYLARSGSAPITIAWDTLSEPDHVIYVHPHSGAIPPRSELIVEENQQAIYRAAGRYHVLKKGHYPIFTDIRSEAERIEATYTEITGDDILLQLDTRIIFFDCRYHEEHYRAAAPLALPDVDFAFLPSATYELCIDDPAALMTHALDLSGQENELALLNVCRRWIARAITCTLSDRIHAHFGGMLILDDGDAARQVESCLRRALPPEDCEAAINRMLAEQGRGLRIRNLIPDWDRCLQPREAAHTAHMTACPHCGGAIPDTGKGQLCPTCGQKAQWCPTCNAYRRLDARKVCIHCNRKLYDAI